MLNFARSFINQPHSTEGDSMTTIKCILGIIGWLAIAYLVIVVVNMIGRWMA